MNADQKQKIEVHLRSKFRNGCPICSGKNFGIDNDIQFLGALNAEFKQPIEGAIYPVVGVSCNDCYFTAHFSASRLGLL
jgi:ssDNA-binding Zn-finger/Zn-ribbon topoisomerase 1